MFDDVPIERRCKSSFLVNLIEELKKKNEKINLVLTRDEVLEICHIYKGDRQYNYDLGYLANWLRTYVRNFYSDIKISYRSQYNNRNIGVMYIMDIDSYNKSELPEELRVIRKRLGIYK